MSTNRIFHQRFYLFSVLLVCFALTTYQPRFKIVRPADAAPTNVVGVTVDPAQVGSVSAITSITTTTGSAVDETKTVSEEGSDPVVEVDSVLLGDVSEGEDSEDTAGIAGGESAEGISEEDIVSGGGIDTEGAEVSGGTTLEVVDDGGDIDDVTVEEGSGEIDPDDSQGGALAVDVDCSVVPPFPEEVFSAHPDIEKVYYIPSPMPEGIFLSMGFDRFVSVFGVHIVGSKGVSDDVLKQAAHVFSGVIDNDGDGLVDMKDALQSVIDYRTVIGYVSNADESDMLWKDLYVRPENEDFRQQFACNIHFFEQWASDATPEFYKGMQQREGDTDTCTELEGVDFDWRLWYFPFTLTYYGYQEVLPEDVLNKIESVMTEAREKKVFFGNYPNDKEMEMADFFVWSLLTKLGALECHCSTDIIQSVWQLCTAEALKEFDEKWFDLLGSIEGLPTVLPSGTYKGKALVKLEELKVVPEGGEAAPSGGDSSSEVASAESTATGVLAAGDAAETSSTGAPQQTPPVDEPAGSVPSETAPTGSSAETTDTDSETAAVSPSAVTASGASPGANAQPAATVVNAQEILA